MGKNDFLADALTELGWSQGELAGRIQVHRNTVSAWATGKPLPGPVRAYLELAVKIRRLME